MNREDLEDLEDMEEQLESRTVGEVKAQWEVLGWVGFYVMLMGLVTDWSLAVLVVLIALLGVFVVLTMNLYEALAVKYNTLETYDLFLGKYTPLYVTTKLD